MMTRLQEELQLFDHVFATYQPPPSFNHRKTLYPQDIGKRGIFQVAGVIQIEEKKLGTPGELAMMPRDLPGLYRFNFSRCPIGHLADLERAPEEVTRYRFNSSPATRPRS